MGLSTTTYKRGRAIIEKGTEEQKCKLKLGKTKINKEYNVIRREEKRQELLRKSLNIESPLVSEQHKIICGDFKIASSEIPDDSVDSTYYALTL